MADTTGPRVITPYPAHGGQNVAVNTIITAQFNEAVDHTTVTSSTVIIVEQNTFAPVDGVVSYVPATRQAKFTPSSSLKSNTKYRVIILGLEDPWAVTPIGIQDTNGNYMNGQFDWTFTTGGTTSSDPSFAALPSGVTGYENATAPNPTGIIIPSTYLKVVETDPENYESDLPVTSQITIKFNDNLEFDGQTTVLGTAVLGESHFSTASGVLNEYISIANNEVLGTDAASHNPLIWTFNFNNVNHKLTILPSSGSLAADAAGSHWNTKGTYTEGTTVHGVLEENNEYIVTIKAGLPGATTLSLQEDYTFLFTTQYDPRFASSIEMRLILGNIIEDIPDDTINRIIHQNSISVLELYAPKLIANTGIPWYIPKYVECKTAYDLIKNKFLNLGGVGSRKVLADLTIDRSNQGRDIVALGQFLLDDLQECINQTLGLVLSGGSAPIPDYAIPHVRDSRGPIRDATWRRLPKMLARNAAPGPGRRSARSSTRGKTSRYSTRNAGFLRRKSF